MPVIALILKVLVGIFLLSKVFMIALAGVFVGGWLRRLKHRTVARMGYSKPPQWVLDAQHEVGLQAPKPWSDQPTNLPNTFDDTFNEAFRSQK